MCLFIGLKGNFFTNQFNFATIGVWCHMATVKHLPVLHNSVIYPDTRESFIIRLILEFIKCISDLMVRPYKPKLASLTPKNGLFSLFSCVCVALVGYLVYVLSSTKWRNAVISLCIKPFIESNPLYKGTHKNRVPQPAFISDIFNTRCNSKPKTSFTATFKLNVNIFKNETSDICCLEPKRNVS